MKQAIIFMLLLMSIISNAQEEPFYENYWLNTAGPGYSFATEDADYRGWSFLYNMQVGTGYFHMELSTNPGWNKTFFWNDMMTFDIAGGIPFRISNNSEALIALSPFSINWGKDGNIGLATLLKYKFGFVILETKLVLKEYGKSKSGDPFLQNNSYYGLRLKLGESFGLGARYTFLSKDYNYASFLIFF